MMRRLALLFGVVALFGSCRHGLDPAPADRGRDWLPPGAPDGRVLADGPRADLDGPRTPDGPHVSDSPRTSDLRSPDRAGTPDLPAKPDQPRDQVPQCPGGPITTDPAGCVKATCSGWPAPQVHLSWCGQPGQTANAVQRGLCCPGDPSFSWQAIWGDPTLLLRAWTDTTVSPNLTYTYRIKFRPDLASNNINVPVTACNCGG